MNIVLIRHAESTANVDREIYRKMLHHEIPLTDKGVQQAKELSYQLEKILSNSLRSHLTSDKKEREIDLIVSPYTRTRDTAKHMLDTGLTFIRDKIKVRYEPLVCEHIVGSNAQAIKSINMDYDKFKTFWYTVNGAESYAEVYNRAKLFLTELRLDYQGTNKTVVVVSHGGFLSILEGILLGTDPENSLFVHDFNNCEMKYFEGFFK